MLAASPTQHITHYTLMCPKKKFRVTRRRLEGRGGYKEIIESAKQWTNSPKGKVVMQASRGLLNYLLPGAGTALGTVMNHYGWGKYTGSKNTILEASPVPLMHAMPDKGVRVVHREFIGFVNSSVDFVNLRHSLNPGISSTFPWLSGLAINFQKYKMNGLIFYFKSTAANMTVSTNNALGAIGGVTQYNPYDPEPQTFADALNIAGAMESTPVKDVIFPVECDKFHAVYPTFFVREQEVTDDKAKYDPGVFNIISYGSQAPAVVGQLWVAYDVTLIQPVPRHVEGTYPVGEVMWSCSGTPSAIAPFGDAVELKHSSYYPNPGLVSRIVGNTVYLPSFSRSYHFTFNAAYKTGTNGTVSLPTLTPTSSVTLLETMLTVNGTADSFDIHVEGIVTSSGLDPEPYFVFSGGGYPGGTVNGTYYHRALLTVEPNGFYTSSLKQECKSSERAQKSPSQATKLAEFDDLDEEPQVVTPKPVRKALAGTSAPAR